MSEKLSTIDPAKYDIILGGVPITGFADGTFIEVERDEANYNKTVGADGKVSRSKTNNRSGQLRLQLQQTSGSNDYLSGLIIADELNNSGVVPFIAQDKLGRSKHIGVDAWVNEWPTETRSKEVEVYEWIIEVADITMFLGGNN